MSGRRTEPAVLGPWWCRLTPAEQRLRDSDLRKGDDGRYLIGADPWADCGTCGLVRDTVEYAFCPGCDAHWHYRQRMRAAAEALENFNDENVH